MNNAISCVKIKDFLVFKGEFSVEFCSGVNVLIGGNGTGKTTLMKLMYAAARKGRKIKTMNRTLSAYFRSKETAKLFDITGNPKDGAISFDKKGEYSAAVCGSGIADCCSSVYIPVIDMLSHSEGMISGYLTKDLPFDLTEIDCLLDSSDNESRELTCNAKSVLSKIEEIIGGEVLLENETFYIKKGEDDKTPFSLEASGFRKLGLLWKLLRNGLLEAGAVLFWDEPENSLNPELISKLVDILFELSRGGVQIFAATHSYYVARWFDLNKKKGDGLKFISLCKKDNGISAKTADSYVSLSNNAIEKAGKKLYERVVDVAAENAG